MLFSTFSLSKTSNSIVFTKKIHMEVFFFIRYILFSRKKNCVIVIMDTYYILFDMSTVSPCQHKNQTPLQMPRDFVLKDNHQLNYGCSAPCLLVFLENRTSRFYSHSEIFKKKSPHI